LQEPQEVHSFPEGLTLIKAMLVCAFITSDTGQAILQNARFFLNLKARITATR
jgi:hypothetical protein